MAKVEYLRSYYPFDDGVMAAVEEAADAQQDITWPEFVSRNDVPEPFRYRPRFGKPIEVLDITPTDYDKVYVYHMPMGCLLDSNMVSQVATLASAEPDKRIISASNPAQPGRGTGKLSLGDIRSVWNGDFRATVDPLLEYIHNQGIKSVTHIGPSYGADKAAASAENAHRYDQEVPRAVMIEPVSVKKRRLIDTASSFLRTSAQLHRYLDPATDASKAFASARELKASDMGYILGLARLSNIVIARGLGQAGFEDRVDRAMKQQPEMKTDIVWGTRSELAVSGLVTALAERLRAKYGDERVNTMPFQGHTHAMNVDIFLNTAIVLQAIRAKV